MPKASSDFGRSINTLKCSRWHIGFAVGLAVAGGLTLYLHLTGWAVGVVSVADVYLILLLWSAANKSSPARLETWPGLPYRQPAIVVLPLVLVALVSAFGAMYLNTVPGITRWLDAAYFSFVNLATFTYDHSLLATTCAKVIAVGQLSSGVLLLICAFPLLVSRLAEFGEGASVGVRGLTFNGCRIVLRGGDDASLTIEQNALTWTRAGKTVKALVESADGSGSPKVTVTCQAESRVAKEVVIEADGSCYVPMTSTP